MAANGNALDRPAETKVAQDFCRDPQAFGNLQDESFGRTSEHSVSSVLMPSAPVG